MHQLIVPLVRQLRPLGMILGCIELPLLSVIELFELVSLLVDKQQKNHMYQHWLVSIILKSLFLSLAAAAFVTMCVSAINIPFLVLYLSLSFLGVIIKTHALYKGYRQYKSESHTEAAKRKKYAYFEFGIKITACIATGLLLFLPGAQIAMVAVLISLAVISAATVYLRPTNKVRASMGQCSMEDFAPLALPELNPNLTITHQQSNLSNSDGIHVCLPLTENIDSTQSSKLTKNISPS